MHDQVGGLPLEHDPAGREHVAAVGDRERDVRVLLDDEHGDALVVHLLDDLEALLDEDRSEPHRRLVHQQQLRVRHQRAAHRDHLLLAARERSGQLLAPLVDAREELEDALEVLRRAAGAQVGAHLQVLEHRHRREETAVLGHDRHALLDPVVRRPLRHVLAGELDACRSAAARRRGSSSTSSTCRRRCRRAGRPARPGRPGARRPGGCGSGRSRCRSPRASAAGSAVRAHLVAVAFRPR